MKRSPAIGAFTLIEMLTVMLIIAILASLVLSVNSLVQTKAARARAEGEIKAISLGCENYKVDNGIYPRSKETDELDPRADGNPATGGGATRYQKASLFLYAALNGEISDAGEITPDYKPEGKIYLPEFFKPNVLGAKKEKDSGKITEVLFIQDPFGNSYGYSTKGAKAEEDFQAALRKDSSATRPTKADGYNPTFDLWTTGGSLNGVTPAQLGKWVKNW